ncbi:hypothetical protein BB2000_3092 [Proteus mirabilis BB2000]|nr:hypothetical protein BB2000_3092 [Proteus mirabilis BB2000]
MLKNYFIGFIVCLIKNNLVLFCFFRFYQKTK